MTQPVNHQLTSDFRLVYEATAADFLTWSKQYSFGNTATFNGEVETYLPGNVYTAPDGALVLEGRNIGGGNTSTGYSGKYTSGMVASYNCFLFRYGYLEALIKMPAGQGIWPAFWLLVDPSISNKFEIDVNEIFANGLIINEGIHFNSGGGVGSDGGATNLSFDMSQGYHAYAVEWTPGYIQFYLDGVPLRRLTTTSEFASLNMYVLMNVALSGVAVGGQLPLDSQFPIQMRVQRLRLWQGVSSQYQLVVTPTPNYSSLNVAAQLDGAVAHYPLNDASGIVARDLIGGNNGTITGGVTLGQPAIATDGLASMQFDGITGYVALPASINPTGLSAFTAEISFEYPTSTFDNGRIMANAHTDQTNTGFQLSLTTTGGLASIATTGGIANLYWSTTFAANTPYHYALVYDGSHAYAYLNGVQVGSAALTGTIVSSGLPINIGRGAYGTDYWSGRAVHAAVYYGALSASQIAAHAAILTAPVPVAANATTSPTATQTGNAINDLVSLSVAFTTAAGVAIDPSEVTARVKAPDGTIAIYRYGSAATLFKDGVGAYRLLLYPDQPGTWQLRWEGMGIIEKAIETTFVVNASAFS